MPQRLLGITLIAGGALVGVIIMILMASYVRSGHFSSTTATISVIIAFILLILPQFGLGIYLIWHDLQSEKSKDQRGI